MSIPVYNFVEWFLRYHGTVIRKDSTDCKPAGRQAGQILAKVS